MTEVGVITDSILNNKKDEFENLADNCKVVYSNFFKMISKELKIAGRIQFLKHGSD